MVQRLAFSSHLLTALLENFHTSFLKPSCSTAFNLKYMMLESGRLLIVPTGKHILKIENKSSDKVISVSIGQRSVFTLFSASRTFENVL